MNNRIMAEASQYFVLDCRDTIYDGDYQLLEKFVEKPTERTIGVYSNKRDAIKAFNSIKRTKTC